MTKETMYIGCGSSSSKDRMDACSVTICRNEEACKLLKTLFTAEDLVDFDGQYYKLHQAPFEPKCVQQPHPPIMVGGWGEKRTLRTLAMYGDIMNIMDGPEEMKRSIGREPSPSLKQQGMNLALLRRVEPKMKKCRFRKKIKKSGRSAPL